MNRVDAYLLKTSLKVVLKLVEEHITDAAAKARIRAEAESMVQVLDSSV